MAPRLARYAPHTMGGARFGINNYMVHAEIKRKIDLCQEYLEKLSLYTVLSDSELLRHEEKRLAMERLFLLMVDEAVDINAALAYQFGGRIPETHKSTFAELVPLKILEADFAEHISGSVKVRNQLTHDYEKLSHADSIAHMKRFAELYKKYLAALVTQVVSRA